ncbi:MAG: hypothetical protein EKK41_07385 [Hyphomicrobiales bacterium]|nr:MAG: hypothetical protein EKK41_07385 [Hyphomicrobiales bacterium]
MTRTPKSSGATLESFAIQRIRVRRDGYDSGGTYWGAGADVFIATSHDGADEITVRARSLTKARTKISGELARAPGAKSAAPRDPLGGVSPRKSRYEVDWNDPAGGNPVHIRITHARDYLGMGQDHVEVESLKPTRAPLPITETGYKSHFLPALELVNAGGPVTFVTAWLDALARTPAWSKQQNARQQGDLFQWAEANKETGKRKSPMRAKLPAAKRTAAKPRRSRAASNTQG